MNLIDINEVIKVVENNPLYSWELRIFGCKHFEGSMEYPNGDKAWYKEGKLHRIDGPAIEYPDGSKYWYKEGKRHRIDGPAIEWPDGYKCWYKEGTFIKKYF